MPCESPSPETLWVIPPTMLQPITDHQTIAGLIDPGPLQPSCDDFIIIGWVNPGGVFRIDAPGEQSKAWVRDYRSDCDLITGAPGKLRA